MCHHEVPNQTKLADIHSPGRYGMVRLIKQSFNISAKQSLTLLHNRLSQRLSEPNRPSSYSQQGLGSSDIFIKFYPEGSVEWSYGLYHCYVYKRCKNKDYVHKMLEHFQNGEKFDG